MTFTGIPVAALDFYEDLEADNSKSFWTAHKHVYDESVRAPLEALAAELADEFGPAKLFRPYRDVRFAKDKTPYKTQQGAWFGEASLYVAVSAAGLYVAGGYWDTESDQVERLRRAVADDVAGAELERATATVRKAGFTINGQKIDEKFTSSDKTFDTVSPVSVTDVSSGKAIPSAHGSLSVELLPSESKLIELREK